MSTHGHWIHQRSALDFRQTELFPASTCQSLGFPTLKDGRTTEGPGWCPIAGGSCLLLWKIKTGSLSRARSLECFFSLDGNYKKLRASIGRENTERVNSSVSRFGKVKSFCNFNLAWLHSSCSMSYGPPGWGTSTITFDQTLRPSY